MSGNVAAAASAVKDVEHQGGFRVERLRAAHRSDQGCRQNGPTAELEVQTVGKVHDIWRGSDVEPVLPVAMVQRRVHVQLEGRNERGQEAVGIVRAEDVIADAQVIVNTAVQVEDHTTVRTELRQKSHSPHIPDHPCDQSNRY